MIEHLLSISSGRGRGGGEDGLTGPSPAGITLGRGTDTNILFKSTKQALLPRLLPPQVSPKLLIVVHSP